MTVKNFTPQNIINYLMIFFMQNFLSEYLNIKSQKICNHFAGLASKCNFALFKCAVSCHSALYFISARKGNALC
jgi:hypothetical protein